MPSRMTLAAVAALLAATIAGASMLVASAQTTDEPTRRAAVTVEDRPATTVAHTVIEGALP